MDFLLFPPIRASFIFTHSTGSREINVISHYLIGSTCLEIVSGMSYSLCPTFSIIYYSLLLLGNPEKCLD